MQVAASTAFSMIHISGKTVELKPPGYIVLRGIEHRLISSAAINIGAEALEEFPRVELKRLCKLIISTLCKENDQWGIVSDS